MTFTDDYLFELGTEELPPKSLVTLANQFAQSVESQLQQHQIAFKQITPLAAPRRLALLISELEHQQPTQKIERRGPAIKAAFQDDGSPSKAALGFAKSCGVSIDELEKHSTDKGSWLYFRTEQPGQPTRQLLPKIITQSLQQLPIPKRMRWGNQLESFIRPIHWVVSLHGESPVPITLWEHHSSNITYGHRVHAPNPITIQSASNYEALLESQGYVRVDHHKRRQKIKTDLETAAAELNANIDIPDDLLTEVTALVEWPVVFIGNFAPEFLQVPKEVLTSTMQAHQKYFSLLDENNQLLPKFAMVANLESTDPSAVIAGNEKVIHPRFSDAQFFYQQDQKQPLETFNQSLETLLFQRQLGSMKDKVLRVQELAIYLAEMLQADAETVSRAALLCKADLPTQMVQEFPELQGIMGGYYAQLSGEPQAVSKVISEHYAPLNMDGAIPSSLEGCCVALADKLDTLVGIFSTGQLPTGDKDPFALRRAAAGVIKILLHTQQSLDVMACLNFSQSLYPEANDSTLLIQLQEFFEARFPAFYPNLPIETINAVLTLKQLDPYDIELRLKALTQFQHSDALRSLSSANKRVNNLLKKVDVSELPPVEKERLQHPIEIRLLDQSLSLQPKIKEYCLEKAFPSALEALSHLKDTVDTFFDEVHIMVEDITLQQQRLSLLNLLRQLFLSVADISKLATDKS